jgi:hypothetical protein
MIEAVILVWFGPLGVDIWAHTYYLSLLAKGRVDLWNFRWYSGSYVFVGYGFLPYLLALWTTLKGLEFLAIAATVLASFEVGRRLESRLGWLGPVLMALSFPLTTMSGAVPYLCAVSLCSWAVVAVLARRRAWFSVCIVFAVLCSALAVAFLGLFLLTLVTSEEPFGGDRQPLHRYWRAVVTSQLRFYVLVDLSALAAFGVVSRAFPSGGRYPFYVSDLVVIVIVSGLLATTAYLARRRLDPRLQRALIVGAGWYVLSSLVLFVIPSPVGANLSRLSEFGLPLLGLIAAGLGGPTLMRRASWRHVGRTTSLCCGALVVMVLPWSTTSVDGPIFNSSAHRTAQAEYWRGAVAYLVHHTPPGQRVELVDPASHSGDYYLAHAGLSLVRGWFRQDDFPVNGVLYSSSMSLPQYLRFLQRRAASYVVLPVGPYDFSSQREAQIVAEQPRGLRLVWRDSGISIFSVVTTDPLISGGKVVKLHQSSLTVQLTGHGVHLVRANFSPYLHPSQGCLERVGPGLMRWSGVRSGRQTILFSPNVVGIVREIVSPTGRSCS